MKLADYLFKDWQFYTFPRRDSTVVVELFRKRLLRRNDRREVEFWCSDAMYFDPQKASLRNMYTNDRRILEGMQKGYFTVHVNSDIVVFLLYNKDALIKDVVGSIREVLHFSSTRKAVVTHRHRRLTVSASMSSNLLRAGNKISIDFG